MKHPFSCLQTSETSIRNGWLNVVRPLPKGNTAIRESAWLSATMMTDIADIDNDHEDQVDQEDRLTTSLLIHPGLQNS